MNARISSTSKSQAETRLEKLRKQREEATSNAWSELERIPLGQPIIEGHTNPYKYSERQFEKARKLEEQETRASERVAMLEAAEKFKENHEGVEDIRVVGRTGWARIGVATSVNNLDYFKQQLEELEEKNVEAKAHNRKREGIKYRTYGREISTLRTKIAALEAMAEHVASTPISEKSQQLIDSGQVNQWQKKPVFYFVKGLRKVALTLNQDGNFIISKRYPALSQADNAVIEKLLA